MLPHGRLLRRLGTLILYLLLGLSVLTTSYLFFFTGRPLPTDQQDASGLPLPPVGEFSSCRCISNCGQFGFWQTVRFEADRAFQNLEMWRLDPPQRIGGIPLAPQINAACLSKDQRLLLTLSTWEVDLWRLPNFEPVRAYQCPPEWGCRGVSFSQDDKQVIVHAYSHLIIFDAQSDKFTKAMQVHPNEVEATFFDHRNRPKCVISRDQVIEVMDVLSRRVECSLQLSTADGRLAEPLVGGLHNCMLSHDAGSLVTGHAKGMVVQWSLSDGAPITCLQLSRPAPAFPVGLSPDGRFLVVTQYEKNLLVLLASRLSLQLGSWLNAGLEPERTSTLIDLREKTQWPGLPFAQKVGFSADSKALLTIGNAITKWDLPPRWRLFSPWAWTALAFCLIQISVLWFMRRGNARLEKCRGWPVVPHTQAAKAQNK